MKAHLALVMLLASASGAMAATAPAALSVSVQGVEAKDAPLPPEYALCVPDAKNHTRGGDNMNPQIDWRGAPEGTKSYAIVMHDTSVPKDRSMANKEGQVIAADAPRQDLFHWVLVDIPPQLMRINRGQESAKNGKPLSHKAAYGMRGLNDLGNRGYDGACPPWNDEALHRYHFTVYALNVENLGLSADFKGPDVLAKIGPHVLAKGEVTSRFTQNPALKY